MSTTTCAACGCPISRDDTIGIREGGAIVCKACHRLERPTLPQGVPVYRIRRRHARRAATVRIEQCQTSRRWWVVEHSPMRGHTPIGLAYDCDVAAYAAAVLHAAAEGITSPVGVRPAAATVAPDRQGSARRLGGPS